MDWQFIIESILYIIISVTVPFIVKYLKTKISNDKMKQIVEFSELAVQFAEKSFSHFSGETRYKHASEWLSQRANEIGIKLSDEDIRTLVESALIRMELTFASEWGKKKETTEKTNFDIIAEGK